MNHKHIAVLPEDVINKIAAGEVIERPASVVKELLENSLDAGATDIITEIAGGGKKLISVTDNGSGIPADEAATAFQRHATSKISTFDDLEKLSSLGFRGEALPSIASVSKVTMITRAASENAATCIQVKAGKISAAADTGAKPGTVVRVEDLFFNTPARQKFLKSDNTEYSHILSTVLEQAIAHFTVGFTLINNGKEELRAPEAKKPEERLYDLFGKELLQELLPLKLEQKFLTITGFVGTPAAARPNRNRQYFYVNNRSVRHRLLNHALSAGYETLLPNGKYPAAFIYFDLDPELVDVNVHPTKREVRFSNESAIHELLVKAVRNALQTSRNIPVIEEKSSYQIPLAGKTLGAVLDRPVIPQEKETFFDLGETTTYSYTLKNDQPFNTLLLGEVDILGQADNAYIVAAAKTGLFIIDQHAASERIMYEKLRQEFLADKIQSQKLLLPINLELDRPELEVILSHMNLLTKLGWEVEEFGKNAILIRALPAILEKTGDRQCILDIVRELAAVREITDQPTAADIKDRSLDNILKLSACHAAVRVGDELALPEMRHLVNTLLSAKTPYTCPHGRPTIIQLTKTELNKRFGRT